MGKGWKQRISAGWWGCGTGFDGTQEAFTDPGPTFEWTGTGRSGAFSWGTRMLALIRCYFPGMSIGTQVLGAALGVAAALSISPTIGADAEPTDDDPRAAQFCNYLRMNGYRVDDCQWMSIIAKGQCYGLMEGRDAWQMMHTSEVMAGAETKAAQWAILKTAVNVYCPILDSTLPMHP